METNHTPTCRTVTQRVNADFCLACREEMRRYIEGAAEPFCACGRRWGDCDRSRAGCRKSRRQ